MDVSTFVPAGMSVKDVNDIVVTFSRLNKRQVAKMLPPDYPPEGQRINEAAASVGAKFKVCLCYC